MSEKHKDSLNINEKVDSGKSDRSAKLRGILETIRQKNAAKSGNGNNGLSLRSNNNNSASDEPILRYTALKPGESPVGETILKRIQDHCENMANGIVIEEFIRMDT